jgi:hypothetical protein
MWNNMIIDYQKYHIKIVFYLSILFVHFPKPYNYTVYYLFQVT